MIAPYGAVRIPTLDEPKAARRHSGSRSGIGHSFVVLGSVPSVHKDVLAVFLAHSLDLRSVSLVLETTHPTGEHPLLYFRHGAEVRI